jgi:hypothetical protein
MEEQSTPLILSIKASPSHIRVAEMLAEQVKKEYDEFIARERAGTLTPRVMGVCSNCKNEFVRDEMLCVKNREVCSGIQVREHYYCTEECQSKGELTVMRKAEEDDERRRMLKVRNIAGSWFASVLTLLRI